MIHSKNLKSMVEARRNSLCIVVYSNKSWIRRYSTTVCTRGRGTLLVEFAQPLGMDLNTRSAWLFIDATCC